MKNIYTLLFALLMAGTVLGQSNVSLKINHQLGANPFQFNTAATNNNSVPFNVSRLQYYISQITLIHDGGQQTLVPNTWILVDAGTAVNQMLGSFSITNLEAVRFGVGVEAAVNHDDPSAYAASHPLAPKSPSMHWGWTAGYRFVCMEGKAGNQMAQTYEIHALEDPNYFLTTIPTNGVVNGGNLDIELIADYEMALKNIDVSAGPITHGGFGEAITLLQNFRDEVFTSANAVGIEEALDNASFGLSPNPITAGQAANLTWNGHAEALVRVFDLTGKLMQEQPGYGNAMRLELLQPGFYLVSVVQEGKTVGTRKLMVVE